ncbi:MAG: YoaK family protein [Herbinix sp.]|nr:YoaK family protein [Herbinix sp.]
MNSTDNMQIAINKIQLYESVPFGILLSVVGGFLDAYTYICRHGVFANAQTGNIVLLGIHASKGEWKQALLYIPPILAFIIGVIVVEMIKKSSPRLFVFDWPRAILILETFILFAIGFIPQKFPDIIVTVIISFVASVQVCSFCKLVDTAYATTMMTGNLRSFSQAIYKAVTGKDRASAIRAFRYFIIVLSFIIGAIVGGIVTLIFGVKAIWGSVILLLCPVILTRCARAKDKKEVK